MGQVKEIAPEKYGADPHHERTGLSRGGSILEHINILKFDCKILLPSYNLQPSGTMYVVYQLILPKLAISNWGMGQHIGVAHRSFRGRPSDSVAQVRVGSADPGTFYLPLRKR